MRVSGSPMISSGMELETDVYLELYDESVKFECTQRAFGFLARRSRSAGEMKTYLRKKKYSDLLVEETVNLLVEKGYINDYDFAVSLINDRIRQGRWGRDLIIRDLYLKGVSKRIIDRTIRETGADKPDPDILYGLALKKFMSVKDKSNSFERVGNFLRQRGFDFESIRKALDRLRREENL